jgi:glyoxylase-like metal-dependent hydrolase (beta-lactamase superfamily II)
MKTNKKMWLYALSFAAASVTAVGFGAPLQALDKPSALRMYTLDCGSFDAKNMGMFSDTGEFDNQPGKLVGTCFLLWHPKGALLWDTGLSDALAAMPNGVTDPFGITLKVTKPLVPQLTTLGLKPNEINYVAFSHLHADHTGNANAFSSSTWLIGKSDFAWAHEKPTPVGVDPKTLSGHKKAQLQFIEFDHDVFGDGSVRILRAPGHTPGHQVLLVSLAKAGKLLLSGDLFHTKASAAKGLIPLVNNSRADSLASIDRINKLLKSTKARLIVQHAPEDFASLPTFPAYLD